jgi:preprotein translocase subunit SecY
VANSPAMNPAAALGGATRFGEIRSRLMFLIGALVVYRIGTFIPVPGIDPERVAAFFNDQAGTILGVVNMFSGGALERLSIFAMGVMPYISASIIIQMMSMVVPSLMELRKEGESGRRKITQLTRYGTVVLGVFQSFAAAATMQSQGMVLTPGFFTWIFPATVTMTTGTMFLMWLGEQITERGIGNGISMIILVSILSGLPGAFGRTIEQVNTGEMQGPVAVILLGVVVLVTAGCVFMERAQRRITVNYAKRQVGRRMMGIEPAAVSGYHRRVWWPEPRLEDQQCAEPDFDIAVLWPAAASGPVRCIHHWFRLLLYRAGVQRP